MRIVVIGANGQLGMDICDAFRTNGDEVVGLNHEQLDVSMPEQVSHGLKQSAADLVVNTAAMHNVEACEADPVQSFAINGSGARNLARVCTELDTPLVHISTDYVFDGAKKAPYVETDCPRPLNAYGNTKLAGEYFIRAIAEKYFILRVSALYGENRCRAKGGLNFVALMLKLAKERDEVRVVNDEFVSPTYTKDVAQQIVRLVGGNEYGLYHCTAQGSCSWYEFAGRIFTLTRANVKLVEADSSEFPAKVERPDYSVLENHNLRQAGLDIMPHWEKGLIRYLGIK